MPASVQKSPSDYFFLPNFCSSRMVFALVLTAELTALMLTLAEPFGTTLFWTDFALRSLYIQWIALASAGFLCASRPWLVGLGHGKGGFFAWLGMVLCSAILAELAWQVLGPTVWFTLDETNGHAGFLLRSLLVTAIVAALMLRYLYEQYRLREQELAESKAKFDALQARIRPHFLFNSMNTIAQLTRSDAKMAESVVQDLADLFRASIGRKRETSTLAEELELMRGYLRIEQQRLGKRLQIRWQLKPLPMDACLPHLALQPLAENAVYHGIEGLALGGEITISADFGESLIELSIANPFAEQESARKKSGNQVALSNLRDRMTMAFGDRAQVNIFTQQAQFKVTLRFPYHTKLP